MTLIPDKKWWKESIIYQLYPASFLDTTGSGIGDLNGITSKLDYIHKLGVDVIWLSPIYKSPLVDMGYDISDYEDINERYGTLQDWEKLLEGVHERGMKLMMDLVVNHTSNEHKWFLESKSSKTNPKRDWYIWRPPRYDSEGNKQPPNNWKAIFQGSVWEYDETTDEYYLHLFLPEQPDLNWENPQVRLAVLDILRYWINKGCDGFRMDVINLISKVDGLPDAPVTFPNDQYQPASQFYANGPRVHEYIREMYDKVLSKHDLITVGETPFTHEIKTLAEYVLPARKELQMVFQFELMDLDADASEEHLSWKKAETKDIGSVLDKYQSFKVDEGFWNAVYTENHDQARSVSRFGQDALSTEWRIRSAKLLAILQLTQSGTQYIYQGQELGLRNAPRDWGMEEYKDIAAKNYWDKILKERMDKDGKKEEEVDMSDVREGLRMKSRDHARMPILWNSSPNAGFTNPNTTPWMRVHDEYPNWNAEKQVDNPNSVLGFWKQGIEFRKKSDVLIYGTFNLLPQITDSHPKVLAYEKSIQGETMLVLLNFAEDDDIISLDLGKKWKWVFGNYDKSEEFSGKVKIRGWEGMIYTRV